MEQKINKDVEKVVLTKEQIASCVADAAKKLDEKFAGGYPLAVCVLKGSVMFYSDLIRAMKTPVQLDFMTVSSYGSGTTSAGTLKIISDLSVPVEGRDVLLVEDIVDSGYTIKALKELILQRNAKSVTAVTLLDKPSRREVEVSADYACFTVGNEFIVGYGLDYAQKYRNLPYIGVLKREIYEGK